MEETVREGCKRGQEGVLVDVDEASLCITGYRQNHMA